MHTNCAIDFPFRCVSPYVALQCASNHDKKRFARDKMRNVTVSRRKQVTKSDLETFSNLDTRSGQLTAIDEFLTGEAAARAIVTLYETLTDARAAAGVKVQAALGILERAGYTAKRHERKDLGDVDISAMSPQQMRQALAKIDAELASHALDITPLSAPDDKPSDSQALDFVE